MTARALDRWTWLAMAIGPTAWFAGLVAKYALTPPAYTGGPPTALRWATAIALVVGIAGAVLALALFLRAPRADEEGPSLARDRRRRFVAAAALALALGSLLLLGADAVPVLLLPPGYEP